MSLDYDHLSLRLQISTLINEKNWSQTSSSSSSITNKIILLFGGLNSIIKKLLNTSPYEYDKNCLLEIKKTIKKLPSKKRTLNKKTNNHYKLLDILKRIRYI